MKVKDRVEIIGACDDNSEIIGEIGTIIHEVPQPNRYQYTVEFDHKIHRGHSGGEKGTPGHCWNLREEHLKPAKTLTDNLIEAFEGRTVTIHKNGAIVLIKSSLSSKKMIALININSKIVKYGDLNTKTQLEYKSIIEKIMKEE